MTAHPTARNQRRRRGRSARTHLWTGVGVLLLALGAGACGDGEADAGAPEAAPLVSFGRSEVQLVSDGDTIPLRVEVASTDEQRAMGLMERSSLPADQGMLFTYSQDQPPEAGFWMFRTRIPLEIAFVNADGEIVAIRSMEPCASPDPRWCPTYAPGAPYRAALEVNPGVLARHGVEVGDRVLYPDSLDSSTS